MNLKKKTMTQCSIIHPLVVMVPLNLCILDCFNNFQLSHVEWSIFWFWLKFNGAHKALRVSNAMLHNVAHRAHYVHIICWSIQHFHLMLKWHKNGRIWFQICQSKELSRIVNTMSTTRTRHRTVHVYVHFHEKFW